MKENRLRFFGPLRNTLGGVISKNQECNCLSQAFRPDHVSTAAGRQPTPAFLPRDPPPTARPLPLSGAGRQPSPPLPATVTVWLPFPLPKALPGALWRHTTRLSVPWFDAWMEGARKGGVQRKPCSCFLYLFYGECQPFYST